MACTPLLSEEDLYRFRTKQCLRLAKGLCEFGLDRCQYSHSAKWIRRCPYYVSLPSYLRYIPIACPYFKMSEEEEEEKDEEKRKDILRNCIFLTNKDGSVNDKFYKYIEEKNINKCPLGVECPLAHSSDEIDYHPLLYKTKRCENYKKANCNKYYCPDLHGLAEQRKQKDYFIPFINNIEIPPFPHVTVVSKIQYGYFKSQNSLIPSKKKLSSGSCPVSRDILHSSNNSSSLRNSWDRQYKNNSLNVPICNNTTNNNNSSDNNAASYTYDFNTFKRNTVGACNYEVIKNEKHILKKKKKSNYRNFSQFDNKYSFYLQILKKFPFLFDLDVSDINKNKGKKEKKENDIGNENDIWTKKEEEEEEEEKKKKQDEQREEESKTEEEKKKETKNENENENEKEKEKEKEKEGSANNITKQTNDQNNGYNNTECVEGKSDININQMKNETKDNGDIETENVFLNNAYYEILDFIFQKNANLSREYIQREREREIVREEQMKIRENNDYNTEKCVFEKANKSENYSIKKETDIILGQEKSHMPMDSLNFNVSKDHYTETSTVSTEINEYEYCLNELRNILCLLYFTMDSQTHTVFDQHVHKLSQRLHSTCKKKRNAALTNYLNRNINEIIQLM